MVKKPVLQIVLQVEVRHLDLQALLQIVAMVM